MTECLSYRAKSNEYPGKRLHVTGSKHDVGEAVDMRKIHPKLEEICRMAPGRLADV